MRPRHPPPTSRRAGLVAWIVLSFAAQGAAAGEVIAHPATNLSLDEVREVFLGDKQLAGNVRLVPVDNAAEQSAFLANVLQTDVARYSTRWAKKAFREGLRVPTVKRDDAEVLAYVAATPGAVAYISGSSSGVKVLRKY